jgi:hypothetical protein
MKISVAVFCALAVTGAALADPYTESIQQARRVSDQNNAEQQRIQNQSGAAPGSPSASVDPALAATMQNVSSLQTDIAALNSAPDAGSAADQKIALLNDLSTAGTGTKPAADSVKALVKDLLPALAGKKLAADKQTALARDLHAIFNSSRLTAAQLPAVFDNVQKIFTDAGVAGDATINVITDLKKIADETK